jgi:class 3 adenylate cyclase
MYVRKQTNQCICKNQEDIVLKAKNKTTKLKHEKYVATVAQFDLPRSTYRMIKNQPKTITTMLKHNKICTDLIEGNGGMVIKELGDAVLATFPSMTTACICAINVICNLKRFGNGICTKVTVTYGSIDEVTTRKEPDVYGKSVNLCNRMARWAKDDTIIIEKNYLKELQRYLPKDPKVKISKPVQRNLKEFKRKSLCTISITY